MSYNIPLVADTAALRVQYTGEEGEGTWDAEENRMYVHDGVVAGGRPVWHSDLYDENGVLLLKGSGQASAVNYLSASNAAAGAGCNIGVLGTDADIFLRLQSKGTAQVLAGRQGQAVPVNQRETANPTPSGNGEQLYRADLEELFVYRVTPDKWLGALREHHWTFNSSATGALARQGAYLATASLGLRVDYDSTIVGVGWSLTAAPVGSALEIVSCDGTPTLLLGVATSSATDGAVLSLSAGAGLNVSAGTLYAMRWNDGGTATSTSGMVTVYLRRRAT